MSLCGISVKTTVSSPSTYVQLGKDKQERICRLPPQEETFLPDQDFLLDRSWTEPSHRGILRRVVDG